MDEKWKEYLRKHKFARTVQLGLTKYSKQVNPWITFSGLILTVITIFVVMNTINKWVEVSENSLKYIEKKTKVITEEKIVRDTIWNSNCDTVYIIDGERFIKSK